MYFLRFRHLLEINSLTRVQFVIQLKTTEHINCHVLIIPRKEISHMYFYIYVYIFCHFDIF